MGNTSDTKAWLGDGVYYDQPVTGICQVCKVNEVKTFKTIKGVHFECQTCREKRQKKMAEFIANNPIHFGEQT